MRTIRQIDRSSMMSNHTSESKLIWKYCSTDWSFDTLIIQSLLFKKICQFVLSIQRHTMMTYNIKSLTNMISMTMGHYHSQTTFCKHIFHSNITQTISFNKRVYQQRSCLSFNLNKTMTMIDNVNTHSDFLVLENKIIMSNFFKKTWRT